MESPKNVIHLFCFAREKMLADIGSIEVEPLGAKARLYAISSDGVSAVYGFVPAEDFTGPGADEKLRDLSWVSPRAVFHEKVIEEIAQRTPVFPAPFGTIYTSEKNLKTFMNDNRETISSFLDFVLNKNEWAVKGFIKPEKSREAFLKHASGVAENLPQSPGARYLFEQRARTAAFERFEEWLAKILAAARQELSDETWEFRERKPLPESGMEEQAQMIANWALLVPQRDEDGIKAVVKRLNEVHRENGVMFKMSGPWPPFSFTPPLVAGTGGAK